MKHIEDLHLPPETLQLITKGFLKGEKLKMLVQAVSYFDVQVERLQTRYNEDISKRRLSKKEVFLEGIRFLTTHGHGPKDYRNEFINKSQDYILINPFPLIDIGTIVMVYARCHAHLKFFKEAEYKSKDFILIEGLRFRFKSDRELITALSSIIPKKPDAWKKQIQRFDEASRLGKLKRDISNSSKGH